MLKAEFAFSIKTDLACNQIGFDFPQRNLLSQTQKREFIFVVHWVFVSPCKGGRKCKKKRGTIPPKPINLLGFCRVLGLFAFAMECLVSAKSVIWPFIALDDSQSHTRGKKSETCNNTQIVFLFSTTGIGRFQGQWSKSVPRTQKRPTACGPERT